MTTDPAVVLLGGAVNALSAARSLGRRGRNVYLGLEGGGGMAATSSKFVTGWTRPASRQTAAQQWLDWLRSSVPAGSVVLPCSDTALELVATQRSALLGLGMHPVEADDDLLLVLLDKERTYELARAVGVRAPRTAVVRDLPTALERAAEFPPPFAIKPRHSHRFVVEHGRAAKAVVVHDHDGLEAELTPILDAGHAVILTEIVPGADDQFYSYYGYVDADGRQLFHLTKRKLRQHPRGFGTGTYHVTDRTPEVAELGARWFSAVGLLGLGNVEFKRDARDGSLVLIECNMRLTAAVELVRRAGVDLAEVQYQRALGRPVQPIDDYREGLRLWFPVHDLFAARAAIAAGELRPAAYLRQLAHRHGLPVFDPGDPLPSLREGGELMRRSPHVRSSGRGRVQQPRPATGAGGPRGAVAPADRRPRLGTAVLAEAVLLAKTGHPGNPGRRRGRQVTDDLPSGRVDRVEVHVDRDVLQRLGAQLDALHRKTAAPVTARRPWMELWLRAHDDLSVLAVTVHRGDELVGAAVLARRPGVLYDDVRPAGAGASDEVRLPALDAAAAGNLAIGIAGALGRLGRPWRLVLRDVPPADPVVLRLAELLPHAAVVPGDVSPRLTLGPARELRAYVSRNHHQQSRRLRNRLARDGHDLSVSQLNTPAEIHQVLPEVLQVCRARDYELRRYSQLDRAPDLTFFCDVVRAHAALGEVELTTLRVDGALAAYDLCFKDGDAWRMWSCRFDPRWARYGAGRLSHDASLQAALDDGATEYDWMRGGEAYKDALSDHAYRVDDLYAASNSVLWAGFESVRRSHAGLRDAKNSSPAAVRAWERMRPFVEGIRRS